MKVYTYRLESVLRIRRLESALAEQRVRTAALTAQLAHDDVLRAIAQYNDRPPSVGTVETTTFVAEAEQGSRLACTIDDRRDLWQALQRECDGARQLARKAARHVKVLEEVDSRHRRVWLAQTQHEEAAILDDVATTRAAIKLMKAVGRDH